MTFRSWRSYVVNLDELTELTSLPLYDELGISPRSDTFYIPYTY